MLVSTAPLRISLACGAVVEGPRPARRDPGARFSPAQQWSGIAMVNDATVVD